MGEMGEFGSCRSLPRGTRLPGLSLNPARPFLLAGYTLSMIWAEALGPFFRHGGSGVVVEGLRVGVSFPEKS